LLDKVVAVEVRGDDSLGKRPTAGFAIAIYSLDCDPGHLGCPFTDRVAGLEVEHADVVGVSLPPPVVDGRSATRWDAQIEERRNWASHRADGSLPLEGPALQRVEAVVFAAEGSAQLKRGCEAEQHRKSNPARAATAQATQPVPMLAPSCMCAVAMDSPSAPRGNSMKSLKLVQNISQVDPRRATREERRYSCAVREPG
jgi:hypothetical protein